MAPNSNFDYSVDWENQALKPEKYQLQLVAKTVDGRWGWTKDFTISSDEAKTAKNTALGLEKDYTWLYIVGGILLLLLLITATYLLVNELRRKNKKTNKSRKNSLKFKNKLLFSSCCFIIFEFFLFQRHANLFVLGVPQFHFSCLQSHQLVRKQARGG